MILVSCGLKKPRYNRVMHGQYVINTDRHLIDEEDTCIWLSMRDVKGEIESGIIATQDLLLKTQTQIK
jgi:hypothetical protein